VTVGVAASLLVGETKVDDEGVLARLDVGVDCPRVGESGSVVEDNSGGCN
jgi:hypothetical protein